MVIPLQARTATTTGKARSHRHTIKLPAKRNIPVKITLMPLYNAEIELHDLFGKGNLHEMIHPTAVKCNHTAEKKAAVVLRRGPRDKH